MWRASLIQPNKFGCYQVNGAKAPRLAFCPLVKTNGKVKPDGKVKPTVK